ncbi:MAG: adenosylcobinamide-GDP ribazoletransferase [Pseudomonadota bacterium]
MPTVLFDLYRTLRFATRLPLPTLASEMDDPIVPADRFAPAFVLCGALVGLAGGVVAALLMLIGADPLIASIVGIASLVILTGALHEDGLADCADGVGGGRTRERKLEIMRDPTVGSYAVLALVLSALGRVAALAALLAVSPWLALGALIATQSLSRGASMLGAAILPSARPDGAGARLGQPSMKAATLAVTIGGAIAALALLVTAGPIIGLVGLICVIAIGALASFWVLWLADRHLGGQTGDVLGAVQQMSDLAGLIALSISVSVMV